jgi:hypothetical protein
MDEPKMTRDDIIRMAREVGFVAYGEDAGEYRIPTPAFHNRLERFFHMAQAAVIEQGYRKCAEGQKTTQFCGMLQQAVLAEREACAKVCDKFNFGQAPKMIQDAIRARGQA